MAWFAYQKPKGRRIEANKHEILISKRKRLGFDRSLKPPVLSDVLNQERTKTKTRSQMEQRFTKVTTMTPQEKQRLTNLWKESVQRYSDKKSAAAQKAIKNGEFLGLTHGEVQDFGTNQETQKYKEAWEKELNLSTYDFGDEIVGVSKDVLLRSHPEAKKKNKLPKIEPIEVRN